MNTHEHEDDIRDNVLATWLGSVYAKIEPYQTLFFGLLVVIGAIWFGVTSLKARQQARLSEGWNGLINASSRDDLEQIATTHADSPVGVWAIQKTGDFYLAEAAVELYRDQAKGRELLDQAKQSFEKVIAAKPNPLFLQRAHFGLAQVYECLQEFDKAKAEYELIVSQWPDSVPAEYAQDRLELVSRKSTVAFYDWFYDQEPLLSDAALGRTANGPGTGGAGGADSGLDAPMSTSLPDSPDVSLPSVFDGDLEPATEAASESADEQPAESGDTVSGEGTASDDDTP